jgi:hypothetical protein
MAGIAATYRIDAESTTVPPLAALDAALAARGPDGAHWRSGRLGLLVRAVIPMVHEHRGAALVLDGVAEVSAIGARYADLGAPGLLAGSCDPYAAILADTDREILLLARQGDGPPLYYAITPQGALVASEPGALLAAGVPATPDLAVVDRFLAAGVCDDTHATFYAGIHLVLPDQVVEVDRDGVRPVHRGPRAERPAVRVGLGRAVASGRIGVLFTPGPAGAALLGTALAQDGGPPYVYSTTFAELSSAPTEYAAAVLGSLPPGAVRHRALPVVPAELDLDGYLADVGEPTPDPAGYLLWAAARAVAGEVDALVDAGPAGASPGAVRVADRLESRFGVAVRFPFGAAAPPAAEIAEVVERTLPAAAAEVALAAPGALAEPPLRELLAQLRDQLLTTFLAPRYQAGCRRELLDAVDRLVTGRRVDAAALFRRYSVERWLRRVERAAPVRPGSLKITIGALPWTRLAIPTGVIAPGDRIAETAARHVAELLATDFGAARSAAGASWYVLLAAKPVAVAQGRARPVWEIRTGPYARALSRFAGGATGLDTPWAAQVASEVGGAFRLAAAAGCAVAGRTRWYERLAGPQALGVRGPRPDAVPPARVAVVAAPEGADDVAAETAGALRAALPGEVADRLSGVAVVGVDGARARILGWAGRPLQAPGDLLAALCAGNPFGQAEEGTPVVVALSCGRPSSGVSM